MSIKLGFAAAAALSTLLASSAFAGTVAGGSFKVQVTVAAGCSIKTDMAAIDFGTVSGVAAVGPAAQTTSPVIICTNTTPYDLHMTTANNFNMNFGAGKIPYVVKATLGGKTSTLGSTQVASNFSFVGTGAGQTIAMSFDIPVWSATNAPGNYTDTVTMNVDF